MKTTMKCSCGKTITLWKEMENELTKGHYFDQNKLKKFLKSHDELEGERVKVQFT